MCKMGIILWKNSLYDCGFIHYFYNMRQLDLFGFATETPLEKEPEKSQFLIEEEIVPVQSETEEKPYSLVDLAEEVLSAAEEKENGVSQKASSFYSNPDIEKVAATEDPEKENIVFETKEIFETGLMPVLSGSTGVQTETTKNIEFLISEETLKEQEKKINQDPKATGIKLKTSQQQKGSVIFEDGKITVKIKGSVAPAANILKTEKAQEIVQKRGRKSFKEIDAEVDLIEIPEDEVLYQKQYYPISEVARWFRVNTSLLRFWENEFDVLKPKKNRKGDRLFRPEDVKNLELIYQLLRERKYTIEGAKEYIRTNKKKADVQLQLTSTLKKFKIFLLDLKANL